MSQIRIHLRTVLLVFALTTLIASTFLMGTPSRVFAVEVGVWTNMEPTTAPPTRIHAPMTYLVESDLILLFGGFNPSWIPYNDTWVYDYNTNTWTQRMPSSAPETRGGHTFSYDIATDLTVLFGGWQSGGGDTLVNRQDTWIYDFDTNTWTERKPAVSPPPRSWSASTYIRDAGFHILFGGLGDGGALLGDTWIWDIDSNVWTQLNPVAQPPARFDHRMIDASLWGKVILVGGITQGGLPSSDVWAYDYTLNTWSQLSSTSWGGIASHAMTYDSGLGCVLLFGGSTDAQDHHINSNLWSYNYSANAWSQVSSTVWPPATTRTHMAYDTESNRSILFNGRGPSPDPVPFNDTWALHYYDEPPPPPIPGFPTIAIFLGLTITIGLTVIYRRQRK